MTAILRFVGRRLQNGALAAHPFVRRVIVLLALVRWIRRRFPAATQRIALKRGESLRVEVVRTGESRP